MQELLLIHLASCLYMPKLSVRIMAIGILISE